MEQDNSKFLIKALQEFGQHEIAGPQNNPRIVKYFQEIGATWYNNDETPWCGAFCAWVYREKLKLAWPEVSADAWLKIGIPVQSPKIGDIVVFKWNANSKIAQHVGIFISKIGSNIYTLGGNQADSVNITPYNEAFVIGYRHI